MGVEVEGKPVTNQKSSGRCWLFAMLNMGRQPFIKQFNLEDMEFSQGHLFYWDKIERANYFLHNIVLTARRGEEVTGRTVSYLLSDPINDGGQWDMAVNLVTKYGMLPKKCFPETFSCESSSRQRSSPGSTLTKQSRYKLWAPSRPWTSTTNGSNQCGTSRTRSAWSVIPDQATPSTRLTVLTV